MKLFWPQILITSLLLFGIHSAIAQDDCTVKLIEAEKLYEEGKIEKVPDLIDNCIESGFNKENKVNALRLLTLVYLSEDNIDKAEETLLQLLKVEPEYQIDRNLDPIEFIRLYSMYNTESVFSIGIVGGANITTPRLINTYTLYDFDKADSKYSSNGLAFAVGIKAIYHINDEIDIILEPKFSQHSYTISENTSTLSQFSGNEKISYIDFPLLGSYYFYNYRQANFYADLGFSYGMLISSKINDPLNEYPGVENPDVKGSAIDAKGFRKDYLLTGIIGAGVKYKFKRDNIQLNLRYNFGFNNIINDEKRDNYDAIPDNEDFPWKYSYEENDFSISNFSILISYNREFYIHKKKK